MNNIRPIPRYRSLRIHAQDLVGPGARAADRAVDASGLAAPLDMKMAWAGAMAVVLVPMGVMDIPTVGSGIPPHG